MVERSTHRPPIAQLLHNACQRADSVFAQAGGTKGLTRGQFAVLSAVRLSEGAVTQAALVAVTGIDRSTMANLTARLDKRGWLSRTRAEHDRRAYDVRLTSKGAAALAAAEPAARKTTNILLAPLSKEERAQFLAALEKIMGDARGHGMA